MMRIGESKMRGERAGVIGAVRGVFRGVFRGAVAAAFAVVVLAAPVARAADAPDPVVGQRGPITLTASQVKQLMDMADPDVRRQMQADPNVLAQKVRERVLQLVLLNEAIAHKWDQRPEVAFRAQLAAQNAIVESYVAGQVMDDLAFPSDEQLQAAYEANKSKLLLPRQYHLAQIFIAAPLSSGVQGDADGLRRINDLRNQIVKQKGDFAVIAKKSSEDKNSAAKGGELGWLREDVVIPPIRTAVAGMAEGAVSDPIRSNEGWHLVKLLGTRPAAPATFAEAREALIRGMRKERVAQNQRTFVGSLLHDEPIQVNEIELGKLIGK